MFNSFGALRVPIQTTHTFSGGSSSPILVKLTGMYEYYIVEYVNRANFCYSSALFHWRSWARGGVLGKRIDAKKWRFNIYSTKNLSIIPDRLAWMAFYAGGQPANRLDSANADTGLDRLYAACYVCDRHIMNHKQALTWELYRSTKNSFSSPSATPCPQTSPRWALFINGHDEHGECFDSYVRIFFVTSPLKWSNVGAFN